MRIVLSGGEKGTYRNVLLANGVDHLALNITQFVIPKTKPVDLAELLGGATVFVYSSEGDEDVTKYDEFIRAHHTDIERVIGRPDYDGTWLGSKYVPLWNDPDDLERLAYLCERFGRVAISDKAINKKSGPRIKQLHQRWGAELIGLTSKIEVIESYPWSSVIVSSWNSVMRFGETQVWDMNALRRYPAQQKESARKRHRADIVRLGVDFDAVMEDDVTEIAKLAIRSWLAWEAHTFGITKAYDPVRHDDEEPPEQPEMGKVIAMSASKSSSPNTVSEWTPIATTPVRRRHENERSLLPVVGMEALVSRDDDDMESLGTGGRVASTIQYVDSGVRNCDSCYLAPKCPVFEEHANCAYRLPVELRTKDQLRSALRAMLEMQTSRILFARFAEELEGQGIDPALSNEVDRLFRLTREFKDIEDTRDLVRFEMEAKGEAGVLSRIFGQRVGQAARQLDTPLSTRELDQVIIDSEVLDP